MEVRFLMKPSFWQLTIKGNIHALVQDGSPEVVSDVTVDRKFMSPEVILLEPGRYQYRFRGVTSGNRCELSAVQAGVQDPIGGPKVFDLTTEDYSTLNFVVLP